MDMEHWKQFWEIMFYLDRPNHLKRSCLIRRKTDWSENKKKKCRANCFCRPKVGPKFLEFLKICQDAQEGLSFF